MDSPFIIPLAFFAMVVLIVTFVEVMKIREMETDVRMKVYQEEMDHRRRMQELEEKLAHLKQG